MNSNQKDKRRNIRGSVIAAAVVIIISLLYVGFLAFLMFMSGGNPIALPILAIIGLTYVAVIAGALVALHQRIKEIQKGEIYDAKKY